MRRPLARAFTAVFAALLLAVVVPACSQGEGSGRVSGALNVPNCWNGPFELNADFFAAVPYREGLLMRFQRGSDFETFSDGMTLLVTDISKIRPDGKGGSKYGQSLRVDLPAEVTPPGTPVEPEAEPALVNMELYLQRSCRTQVVALHAVDEVTIPADGTEKGCEVAPMMGADPSQGCAPGKEAPGGVGSGKSFIAFTSLSNGKLDEEIASQRLNAGCFDIYLADPRDAQPGGNGPPPICRGHLRGSFSFFFERGRPAQPFP